MGLYCATLLAKAARGCITNACVLDLRTAYIFNKLIIILIKQTNLMSEQRGTLRLVKEYKNLQSRTWEQKMESNFVAHPVSSENMDEWRFMIFGLEGQYENGFYVGFLKLNGYPMKPPSILMGTPTGRFRCNQRLCLSISDYHPESWSPAWGIEKIILGLIQFMLLEDNSVGV